MSNFSSSPAFPNPVVAPASGATAKSTASSAAAAAAATASMGTLVTPPPQGSNTIVAAAAAASASAASVEHEPIDVDGEEEAEEEASMAFLGWSQLTLVGIRYYTGTAHPGEFVALHREPTNPYDRNAIRVDNMHGEKVGHIKGTMASALSPMMDRFGDRIKIDGIIPHPGNAYTMPVRVEFYAPNDGATNVEGLADVLGRYLARSHVPFRRVSDRSGASSSGFGGAPIKNERQQPVVVEKKNVDWRTQQKELDDMFEKQTKEQLTNLPPVEVPSQFRSVQFFPHQVLGMRWMVNREMEVTGAAAKVAIVPFFKRVQEKGRTVWLSEITNASQSEPPKSVRGGILADDMGLGKTLQTLALILASPPTGFQYPAGEDSQISAASRAEDSKTPAKVAMEGAAAPAASSAAFDSAMITPVPSAAPPPSKPRAFPPNKTALRKLKVGMLRCILADARIATSSQAKKAELVQACADGVAGGTITAEGYGASCDREDRPQQHAQQPHHPPPTVASRVGPGTACGAMRGPYNGGPICTLIVCPVSVMSNWVHQVEDHVKPGVLRVHLYHGPNRDSILPLVKSNSVDILIASYNTLGAEFNEDPSNPGTFVAPKKRKHGSTFDSIFNIKFHRIVLDEAHIIRSTKTRAFKACKALKAERRFCLTGTPLQNKPDDVQALFSFLDVEPLGQKDVFRRAISQPIQQGDDTGLARLRAMMCHVALRRSKSVANVKITDKSVELRSITFPDGAHKTIYDALFETAKAAFKATLTEGDDAALKNYMSLFETLLRIRQSCCSGFLVPKERRDRAMEVLRELQHRDGRPLTAEEGKALFEKLKGTFQGEVNGDVARAEVPECAVCLAEFPEENAIILRSCSHVFCNDCITKVATTGSRACPLCRKDFGKTDIVKMSVASMAARAPAVPSHAKMDADGEGEAELSPKLVTLMRAIAEMKHGEKGVIFSQFTKFLDVIENSLIANGHTFTRIDGSKNAPERILAMKDFNSENGGPKLILCSLMAAGTGINLTRGNHIFMMDLWWNKAVEDQAMDRVHRIGQKRDVRVVKFIMANSIEERLIKVQEAKAAMGKGTMEKLCPEEMRKARIGALKDLFDIASGN